MYMFMLTDIMPLFHRIKLKMSIYIFVCVGLRVCILFIDIAVNFMYFL